jgi:hypothetical protein
MMRIWLLFVLLVNGAVLLAAPKAKIAVMDLKAKTGIDVMTVSSLTNLLCTAVSGLGNYEVIGREDMQSMLEHVADKQVLGCDDTKCLVDIGGALGVELLVSGDIGKVGDVFLINLKLINIGKAEVMNRVTEKYAGSETGLVDKLEASVAALFGSKATEQLALRGKTGDLYISASMNGAEVTIDGVKQDGATPLTIEGFAAGEHAVTVKKGDSYGSQTFNLKPEELLKLTITLQKGEGSLKIFSKPADARVLVDGAEKGTTPVKLDKLPVGEHLVRVTKNGYMTHDEKIVLGIGEAKKLEVTLREAAFITVDVQPASASISINGVPVAQGSVLNYPVAVGDVTVKITAENYETHEETIKPVGNEKKIMNVNLVGKYGVLRVKSEPLGARVFLNDTQAGATPFENSQLEPGAYRVKLTMPTYADVLAEAAVAKGKATDISYVLKHTQAYLDSVTNVREAGKRRVKTIVRVISGAAALVGGGMAAYYEMQAQDSMDKEDAAYNAYMAAGSDFAALYRAYQDQRDKTGEYTGSRSVWGGVAGAGAVVLGITFAF